MESSQRGRTLPLFAIIATILGGVLVAAIGVAIDVNEVFGFGLTMLGLVGFLYLYNVLFLPILNFSLCQLLAASTMISYFLAGGVSLFLASTEELARGNVAGEFDALSSLMAALYILMFCLVLHLLGEREKRHWREIFTEAVTGHFNENLVLRLLIGIAIVQFYIIYIGEWGYGGYQLKEDDVTGELPGFIAFISYFSAPILGLVGWYAGRTRLRFDLATATLIGIFIIEIMWLIGLGRRYIVFQLLLLSAMYFLGQARTVTFLTFVRGAAMVALLAGPLWLVFYSMRLSDSPSWGGVAVDVNELAHLRTAFEKITTESTVVDEMNENIRIRLYVLGYFASLVARADKAELALGLGLAGDVIEAIPRVLYPGKQDFKNTYGRGEDLFNPRFGLQPRDDANSLVTAAFCDFLWAGLILYPLVIYGVVVAGLTMIKAMKNSFYMVYGLSYMILAFVQVEGTLTDYILPLRVLFVLMIVNFIHQGIDKRQRSSPRSISQALTANQSKRSR